MKNFLNPRTQIPGFRAVSGDKMFEFVPEEERLQALLGVVKNLIVNSRNAEIFRLTEILNENQIQTNASPTPPSKEEIKEKIKEDIKDRFSRVGPTKIKKEHLREDSFKPTLRKKFVRRFSPNENNFNIERVLKIPKISLPSHLNYIKPVSNELSSVDLGKLNPLIKDRNVVAIETEGENEKVYVTGSMGRKPTNIKLTRAEINEVINRFSEASKIPKMNGMFKVAVGKLIFTAMISDSVSPSFVIEKMKSTNPQRTSGRI